MNKFNVLITGINGFIGTNLEDYLKKDFPEWDIYGIDKNLNDRSKRFKLDIKNKDKLKRMLMKIKPRYIFHLAGITSCEDFERLFETNVHTTYILLETIRQIENYRPRIIIPSSTAEYGMVPISRMPIKENFPLRPVLWYGFSKAMQTKLSLVFVDKGLDVVIGRMFNITGATVPRRLAIGKFAYQLALIEKKKKPPIIYTKNLDSKRDFLDIKDICKYLVDVALHGEKGQIYNICRGRSYLIRDLLYGMIKISGLKNIRIVEVKPEDTRSDVPDSYGSVSKLKRIVKHFNPVSIDKSLKETYLYYLKKVN